MRKQELIHLHELLAEVCRYCREEDSLSMDVSEYDSLPVETAAVHRNKAQHREGVLTLSREISTSLEAGRRRLVSVDAE
ncbi:MAG: UPF0058 family protein [Halovenus sp.]